MLEKHQFPQKMKTCHSTTDKTVTHNFISTIAIKLFNSQNHQCKFKKRILRIKLSLSFLFKIITTPKLF
jgi:hypothetical protein